MWSPKCATTLRAHAQRAEQAGIPRENIWLDPGIGFGKTVQHNLQLLRHLPTLKSLGYPILIGTSRKSFIGHLLGGLPPEERLEGTLATLALAVAWGADIVRVHDVQAAVRTVRNRRRARATQPECKRFTLVGSRFNAVGLRFIPVESRFNALGLRFIPIESRFNAVGSQSILDGSQSNDD